MTGRELVNRIDVLMRELGYEPSPVALSVKQAPSQAVDKLYSLAFKSQDGERRRESLQVKYTEEIAITVGLTMALDDALESQKQACASAEGIQRALLTPLALVPATVQRPRVRYEAFVQVSTFVIEVTVLVIRLSDLEKEGEV